MIVFNKKTNTLEQTLYKYSLQNVEKPNLYREIFTYDEIPKCAFNHRKVPMMPADEIWITDTTFRDGQQSREPYTVEQIVTLFDMLHKLGGPKGIIRQTEFFLYSKQDKEAVYKCMERGYEYPEVTGWIRATKNDFLLAKEMGVKECGILVSCSDYHIFKKLSMTRKQALDHYLSIIKSALDEGIKPRCHFEDITRADFYGFVVPFAYELRKLMDEHKIPIKIRVCDTMGYGVPYPGVALPRSVPGIIYGLRHYAGFPSELIEWHGHNDFYKAVVNAATAWLYGASGVNCSLLGIGERTGNTPLEAMVIEYAQLRGTTDGMDTTIITDIAEYYEKEIGYKIPERTPFVGKYFNVTQAGIHADGISKDEEIYNIFDTKLLLKRSAGVAINQSSGLA
ncbi:MAG: 2-isopropylmalate synthase, partial [Clostridiaceae bacterium]|nr:2-isopropylmalate synthase [Clostridiaceae bacterium]